VFTYNATWGGSSWLCENSGQGASALALLGDGSQTTLELLWHAATGGTWGDASWGRGNILVNTFTAAGLSATGGTFTNLTVTQDLTVQRDAIVTRDVTVGNNITVTHDIAAEDIVGNTLRSLGQTLVFGPLTVQSDKLQLYQPVDIVYDAVLGQPIRKVQIPLMSGVEHGGNISSTNGYDQSAGYLHTAPGIDRVFEYTFMIPRGCVSWNLEMLQMSPDSGHANNLVVLKSNRDMDAPTSTPGAIATMGSRTVGSFSGTNAIPVALSLPITELVDPYNNTYFARIGIKGNAAGTNRLYGVRLVYNDPGARNG